MWNETAKELKLYINPKPLLGVASKVGGRWHAPLEGYYVSVGIELESHPFEIWSGGKHLRFSTPEEAVEWGTEQFAIVLGQLCSF
jgi:hypothetical protein